MQIINMLVAECKMHNVTLLLNTSISLVTKNDEFYIETSHEMFQAKSLIIASGGLSIPKLGASNFGYQLAKQFGLQIITPRPALVPLTVTESDLGFFKD